jgi:hypothetical protein
MQKEKKKNQDGLWLPNVILNLFDIDEGCKILLAHFYSFGEKGCYQSNKTLAQIFMISVRTICNRIARLNKYLYIKCPKGYYRTIWVKSHPQVSEFMKQRFNNQQQGVRKNLRSHYAKSGDSTTQDRVFRPRKNLRTTNTYTNTETNKETAADLPLPACGQSSRLLQEREKQALAKIEAFKKKFGIGQKKSTERLSPEEFEKRKQMIKKQLREA